MLSSCDGRKAFNHVCLYCSLWQLPAALGDTPTCWNSVLAGMIARHASELFAHLANLPSFLNTYLRRLFGCAFFQACFEFCASAGLKYSLVALGELCHCFGHDVASILTSNDGVGICDSPCRGDVSQQCGGSDSFDLYAARADHEAAGTTPQEESAIVGESVVSFMAQAPAVGSRLWSEPRLCRFPTRKQLDLFGSKHERICTLFFSLG